MLEDHGLSDNFPNAFISAREFVESWDKEIYELTNLDFFIYLMINHLGNQLEKRFFIRERYNSTLYLSFEDIGTLSFNLGDSIEYFLKDNCFENCPLKCPVDLNTQICLQEFKNDEFLQKRLFSLNAFSTEIVFKEQCMRVHFMNHVILDTLLNFYNEDLNLELEKENLEVMEMADFIENGMVEFIRNQGQSLLKRPAEPAIDHFEKLLELEDEIDEKKVWEIEQDDWNPDLEIDSWHSKFEPIEELFEKFMIDISIDSPNQRKLIANDIELFKLFLTDFADVNNSDDLNDEHILEFLSYWLVQRFALEDDSRIPNIFRTMARFVTWLYNNYGIDYKSSFVKFYNQVKVEVPRVVKALNIYLNEFDLLQALMLRGKSEPEQLFGFYEVKDLHSKIDKTLALIDVHFCAPIENVHLDSSAYLKLKPGDILQATLVKSDNNKQWKVLEIHYIYPCVAKPYVH
jgi:hypothetical protein